MKKQSIILVHILVAFRLTMACAVFAAEVDSFTDRHELADSRAALNLVVNRWLAEALVTANEQSMFQLGNTAGIDYCNRTNCMRRSRTN